MSGVRVKSGRVVQTVWRYADSPEPDRVEVETTPAHPSAGEVFGNELDDHLEAMTRRLRDEPVGREPITCWGCGAQLKHGRWPKKWGWVARPMPGEESVTEVYCSECFQRWGWNDEPEGE